MKPTKNASSKTPVAKAAVRPAKPSTKKLKKTSGPKTLPPIVLRILKAVETIVDRSTTAAAAAVVAKIPPPQAPTPAPTPGPGLNAIQGMVRGELDAHSIRNPQPARPPQTPPWVNQVMIVIACLTLVIVSIIAFKDNGTKAAMSAKTIAESSEKISKELFKTITTILATKADIKSEIESDGNLTRKDINSATAALVDKATLSVGEINKHSSGLAKSIQEKVDSTGSKLEQVKKGLDEQQLPPTTKEIREVLGETLLAFKSLEQPVTVHETPTAASTSGNNPPAATAAPAAPVAVVSQQPAPVVPVMATTQRGIVDERVDREKLAPNTISRRYYAKDIQHGKVKITKRSEMVVVNNHIPGTWHRDNQTSPLLISPTQVVTTYTGVDWVTFTSSGPMEIELLK